MQAAEPSPALQRQQSIDDAVLAALAYADVFDWPLTGVETLHAAPVASTLTDVEAALGRAAASGLVARVGDSYVLAGRTGLIAERQRREAISVALWPRAIRFGRWIAGLPFVSMVAVSGSLAVNAADTGADIDVFVVTEDDRLWTARALVIGMVRACAASRRRGAVLCPNYLVTASNLDFPDRDCFTAHEVAQLVPLFGSPTCTALLERNAWFRDFLPNHPGPIPLLAGRRRPLGLHATPPRRSTWLDRFESWEMHRKVAALTAGTNADDARFDARTCKGHVDGHRQRVLQAYSMRLQRLGLLP